jgi:hypothetical protein
MCLIAHREINGKRGSNIPNDVIDYNLLHNPDGFGIAWRDPVEGLQWTKFGPTVDDGKAFRTMLKAIDADTTIEYVAHWRMATHGDKCIEMSHPFAYQDRDGNEVILFHNGIIDIDTAKGESDTSAWVRKVLAKLPPRWWDDPGIVGLVEHDIGWSRLALMTWDETVRINQTDWENKGGIWYSTEPRGYLSKTYTWPDDDKDEENDLIKASIIPYKTNTPGVWYHRTGVDEAVHRVATLDATHKLGEGDMAEVICETCFTMGEVYKVDGQEYLDIGHHEYSEVGA